MMTPRQTASSSALEAHLHDFPFEHADPPAASLMEALRGIGYNVQTAIADLIDNSISASARTVWLTFHWSGRDSWVALHDDGAGMSSAELSEAMRPGSSNPLHRRKDSDLGRFGLGLKTASLSQCRHLTVASKQHGGQATVRCWDLDYVLECNEWRVRTSPAQHSIPRIDVLEAVRHGTIVLWEKLDRLVGDVEVDDEKAKRNFHEMIDRVRAHLGMVFHRFLEGRHPELRIFVNGSKPENAVQPWDPFLEHNPSTIKTPIERIAVPGGEVVVRGFVLPHKDRLGDEQHRAAAGIAGWNAQQGFYVYRNKRLLVPGSWLDLGWTKEEHYKLARIAIEIPNSLDADWKIDVRKSTARPPQKIRYRLKDLADRVRRDAREIFSHRGASRPRRQTEPLIRAWESTGTGGRIHYRINRGHPVVDEVLRRVGTDRALIEKMLSVLEATVPVHQIWLDIAERPDDQATTKESIPERTVQSLMQQMYNYLRLTANMSADAARRQILRTEPFDSYEHILTELTEP